MSSTDAHPASKAKPQKHRVLLFSMMAKALKNRNGREVWVPSVRGLSCPVGVGVMGERWSSGVLSAVQATTRVRPVVCTEKRQETYFSLWCSARASSKAAKRKRWWGASGLCRGPQAGLRPKCPPFSSPFRCSLGALTGWGVEKGISWMFTLP